MLHPKTNYLNKLYLKKYCKALRRNHAHKATHKALAQRLRTKPNTHAHKAHKACAQSLRTKPTHKPAHKAKRTSLRTKQTFVYTRDFFPYNTVRNPKKSSEFLGIPRLLSLLGTCLSAVCASGPCGFGLSTCCCAPVWRPRVAAQAAAMWRATMDLSVESTFHCS